MYWHTRGTLVFLKGLYNTAVFLVVLAMLDTVDVLLALL